MFSLQGDGWASKEERFQFVIQSLNYRWNTQNDSVAALSHEMLLSKMIQWDRASPGFSQSKSKRQRFPFSSIESTGHKLPALFICYFRYVATQERFEIELCELMISLSLGAVFLFLFLAFAKNWCV